ncbi:hypothetical protein P3T76_011931 [Phytophthora citrophthora]|uniref:RxLR effector protein n=1 Tax=Phytophthora citrophthora TaxID=4793 RepID=A0AAD9G8D1_9STRA|nr:hypothetical protein P3T76_011931 [Phytophthora citrophthora]
MRLTYLLALVIAATLHASGTALPTDKNIKTPAIAADDANVDGGRMLRVVKKEKAEIQEERIMNPIKKLGSFLKKKWDKQTLKEAIKRDQNRDKWINEQLSGQ